MMKKKLTFALLILTVTALSGQYFFDNYSETQKLDTAHAYLMVSERFAELGDKEQAEEFREMALLIYPELLLADKEELENLTAVSEKPAAERPTGPDRSGMIRYFFSKLLKSVTTEDLETADSLIAERLYLPQYDGGLTKAQLLPMVQEIDSQYDLSSFSPSDLYQLDSILVEKVEEGTYLLTVEGADNDALYTTGITFFGRVQTFRFRQFDTGWKIDKITASF